MLTHEKVLEHMGCGDLPTLVDPEFLSAHGLSEPMQYGMVCADVDHHIQELEALGAGPFLRAHPDGPGWTENGIKKQVKIDLALGYSNGQQVELLGPGKGTHFYVDKIPENGSVALHHICTSQAIDELEPRMNAAGFPTIIEQKTGIKGLLTMRVRYFDTLKALGFYVEVIEWRLFGRLVHPGEKWVTRLAKMQRRRSSSL